MTALYLILTVALLTFAVGTARAVRRARTRHRND